MPYTGSLPQVWPLVLRPVLCRVVHPVSVPALYLLCFPVEAHPFLEVMPLAPRPVVAPLSLEVMVPALPPVLHRLLLRVPDRVPRQFMVQAHRLAPAQVRHPVLCPAFLRVRHQVPPPVRVLPLHQALLSVDHLVPDHLLPQVLSLVSHLALPPSVGPSASPSTSPSGSPSALPSVEPSASPSAGPSASPSASHRTGPSASPSAGTSASLSSSPSKMPSVGPSASPSVSPSTGPSSSPSAGPSAPPQQITNRKTVSIIKYRAVSIS